MQKEKTKMFLGYQNDKIAFIAETKEELENMPCVTLDKIEEVEFAEMFNGVIYTSKEELLQAQTKAVEETRAGLYAAQVDPITAHINRLRDEELTPEIAAEIAKLVEERKVLVEAIKASNPYPVEPVVEEPVEDLSEANNNEVVELYSMEI
jgi:hypothetical protein